MGRTPGSPWLARAGLVLPLLPLAANAFGWIFTEMGRQPWVVFGEMLTRDGVSRSVSLGEVLTSFTAFTLIYATLAVVEVRLLLRYARAGAARRPTACPRTRTRHLRVLGAVMELIWFLLIAVLFTGYFVLEGFDFGVGALVRVLGRDERSRGVVLHTIGPVWDGNEVWLITAAGAMFAAFPMWYATLLSGFYLPMLAILLALIGRGVALEFRGKRDEPWWRARWDAVIVVGSLGPAFLWGLVFANIVRGVPLDAEHEYVGGLFDLLSPYALVGGLAFLAVFVTHGAYFVALKTDGPVRGRAPTRWGAGSARSRWCCWRRSWPVAGAVGCSRPRPGSPCWARW